LCVVFDVAVESEWTAVHSLFGHAFFPPANLLQRLRLQPFILAAVCRAWRATALQYAQLWTRVVLDPLDIVTTLDSALWTSYFEMLEVRSFQLPVELVVHLVNQSVVFNSVGPAVFRMAARARSVILTAARTNSWSPKLINRITQYGGRHLESFILHTFGRYTVAVQHLPFFPEVCRLRRLEMDGFTLSWESLDLVSVQIATIKRNWTQETSLQDWRGLFVALPNCTDLTLEIGSCQILQAASADMEPITAHNVRSLVVSPSENGNEAPYLRFPSLQRVQLRWLGFKALAAFIQHSLGPSTAHNFTFLSILVSFCNAGVAIALASAPTVTELEPIACGVEDDFFQTMTHDRRILPRLQKFTWRQPGAVGEPAPPFVEIEGVTRVELEICLLEFVKQRVKETPEGWRLQSVNLSGWPKAWLLTTEGDLLQAIDKLLLGSSH